MTCCSSVRKKSHKEWANSKLFTRCHFSPLTHNLKSISSSLAHHPCPIRNSHSDFWNCCEILENWTFLNPIPSWTFCQVSGSFVMFVLCPVNLQISTFSFLLTCYLFSSSSSVFYIPRFLSKPVSFLSSLSFLMDLSRSLFYPVPFLSRNHQTLVSPV